MNPLARRPLIITQAIAYLIGGHEAENVPTDASWRSIGERSARADSHRDPVNFNEVIGPAPLLTVPVTTTSGSPFSPLIVAPLSGEVTIIMGLHTLEMMSVLEHPVMG